MKNIKNYKEFLNEEYDKETEDEILDRELSDFDKNWDITPEFPNDGTNWIVNSGIVGDVEWSIKVGNEWETVKEMKDFTLPEYSELYYHGNEQFEIEYNSVIDEMTNELHQNDVSVYFYPDITEWSRLLQEDKIEFSPHEPSEREDFLSDI